MTMPGIARRREHAQQELAARGILKSGRFPPGLRLLMRIFPTLKAPYYGDFGIYGVLMGILFGLPFTGILTFIVRLEDDLPISLGIFLGVAAGVMFGAVTTGFMKSVARRTKLTPWADLDAPPAEAPDGAEAYREVEADFVRRPFQQGRQRRR